MSEFSRENRAPMDEATDEEYVAVATRQASSMMLTTLLTGKVLPAVLLKVPDGNADRLVEVTLREFHTVQAEEDEGAAIKQCKMSCERADDPINPGYSVVVTQVVKAESEFTEVTEEMILEEVRRREEQPSLPLDALFGGEEDFPFEDGDFPYEEEEPLNGTGA